MHIDLNRILRDRIGGWKGKLIPAPLISLLERVVHQRELNELLDATAPATGSAFATALYNELGITLETEGEENIPETGRLLFAGNHPLGGLDGIGLIKVLGTRYGDDGVKFIVNDMLMHVEPLRPVFLPINKYGSQGRESALAIRDALSADGQVVVFPAGLVSRIQPDGSIRDLEWQKSFVQYAVKHRRDVVPMRFVGLNRPRFYKLAHWRKKLGIKFNIEQTTLPAELCAARGCRYKVHFGKPVSWQSLADRLAAGETPSRIANSLRETVYSLGS